MGGLSNFLSWVSEEREREIPIGKSKRTQKGETYSQSGSSEAPQPLVWWVFLLLFFALVMRPGVCCPEPAEPALCGQPALSPRADGWSGEPGGRAAVEAGKVRAGPPPCPSARVRRLDAWR